MSEGQWVDGKALMVRCVGTTQTGRQCKTSGLYNCPQCDAFLCSWHVEWIKDEKGVWQGAHCPWCKVKVDGRSFGGWIKRVGRGWYQAKTEEELQHENVDR